MPSILKHLRSSTADKRPAASGMADGQIAINTASGTPGVFIKDSAGSVVKMGPAHVGSAAPNAVPAGSAGNSIGEMWVDNSTTTHGLKYYTGSTFYNLTPSGTETTVGLVELATAAETQTGTDAVRAVTPSGLQSKVSDSTSTTSSTTIASSTAVKSAYDLANAALPKTGGRVTGNLEIGPAGSLSFEGSSDDSFETTIAVADPTADRTITLPDTTGTIITTGDTGTVTSAMILDGTIVDADISASAEIAVSKLADGAARQLLQTDAAGTGVEWASNIDIPGTLDVTGAAVFDSSVAVTGALTKSGNNVVTVGDTGTVTSTMILDDTIVNADINASAAIVDTKLATIATADKVSLSALNIDGGTDIGAALADADLFIVDDGGAGTNRKAAATRITDYAFGKVSGDITIGSTGTAAISSGVIVNADVNASAAIAGTKISPDFGSQNIVTTGLFSHALGTAGAPTITFTGDTNTGIYSPGADQVAISTNGSGRLFVDSSGNVGIGATATAPLDIYRGTNAELRLTTAADGYLQIGQFTNGGFIGTSSSDTVDGALRFGTAATERMRLTSAGLLGLGTSSPNTKLSVVGTAGSLAEAIRVNSNAGTQSGNSGLWLSGNQTTAHYNWLIASQYNVNAALEITPSTSTDGSTFSTPTAVFTQTGRVGIGTTSPTALLSLSESTAPNIDFYTAGSVKRGIIKSTNAVLDLNALTGNDITFTCDATERMRLTTAGRLLVGTSTARANYFNGTGSAWLQVEGTSFNEASFSITCSSATSANAGNIIINKSAGASIGSNSLVANNESIGGVQWQGNDGTEFVNCASITANIDGTPGANDMPGRLVFSTTADGASSPTERMRIGNTGILFTFSSASSTFIPRSSAAANTSNQLIQGAHSATSTQDGTISFIVYTNGNVENTNNSYGQISDIKLKENIVDANSQWDDLKSVRVRNFNFKEGQTHRQIGVIAQELEQVSPGLVYETPDRDEDGNETGEVTKGVSYSVLYMKAVKALQEAMERIETLEAKVAALEAA